jgi:hypothetical protein
VTRIIARGGGATYVRFERSACMVKITIGFVAGFLAGAAVVLWATPKKLQKQIRATVEDQYENVEKLVKKVVNA